MLDGDSNLLNFLLKILLKPTVSGGFFDLLNKFK
jgi:hypothetical protein